MVSRRQVADFWDEVINRFLAGEYPKEPPLDRWIASYAGAGEGMVDFEAYPEPYHGRILGDIRGITLALNPGEPIPEFHYRDGYYAREIKELGSFRKLNEQGGSKYDYIWFEKVGRPSHRGARIRFLEQWNAAGRLEPEHLLSFELYPWHSKRITSGMSPDPAIIKDFVLDPIAESGVKHVWAFGAPWFRVVQGLGLEEVVRLGKGGEPYPTKVESRTVSAFASTGDNLVVVEKHSGGAGPPSVPETKILREEFIKRGLY